MHLPEIDKYAHLKSPFYSWDPRIKIISISLLIISVVLTPHLFGAILGLTLAIAMVLVSRIPFYFIFKHLTWVFMFCIFLLIIMPLTVPDGFRYATLISLRAITAVLLLFPMLGTMKFDLALKALQKLKVPNKLVQMLMFTYRYIFLFIEEVRRTLIASTARGFKKRTNIYTLKITGNLIGMLFVRSFERTERIYHAMISRGYNGQIKILDEFKICSKDILKASLVITTAVALFLV